MSTTVDERSPNYDLPLPHPQNQLQADVLRLRQSLAALDSALATVQQALAGHGHAMGDVTGLDAALAALQQYVDDQVATRSPSSHGHTLTSLGAAAATHSHALADLGAAAASHTHTPASIGAAAAGHGHAVATPGADGFMAKAQVDKLDGVERSTYKTVTGGVIDLSLGDKFTMSVSGNVTVSLTSAHATYREAILLEVNYTSGVITWPAAIKFKTAPTFTAGKRTWITLYRASNGTDYVASVSHEV